MGSAPASGALAGALLVPGEGDVKRKQHVEASPLTPFWSDWNGQTDPATAFAALDRRLAAPL
jgi:hypothetical protein